MDDVTTAGQFEPRMGATDAVMWDIEKDPVLRSTITAIALLDRPPDWERFRDRVERATRTIPRLRQRVVVPPLRIGFPRWVVDPQFDLDYHLRRVRAPEPGTWREVLDLAQPIAMQSFDRARPLWEFTLVEGLEDGRAALIQKLHHAMTDGVGGVELALVLLDSERDPGPPGPMPPAPAPGDSRQGAALRSSVDDLVRSALGDAMGVPAAAVRATYSTLRNPIGSGRDLITTSRSIVRGLRPVPASRSSIMGERSLGRRFETLDVPMRDLRRSGRAVGGSINDALLAAVVGGVAAYHRGQNATLDELRLTMPISFRSPGDPLGGNRFAPVRFTVPGDIADPAERIRVVGAMAHRWAREPFLDHTDTLALALDRLPTSLTTAAFGGMLKHMDVVVTNVPGLPDTVYLSGAQVLSEYAFAPPTGAAANFSLLSMGDSACIGVVVDTAAIPEVASLVRCLQESFEEVRAVGASARGR